jgi:8-oxo-dGTP diphosphatase
MSLPDTVTTRDRSVLLKAGGLVWDSERPPRKLLVVHRPKYGDWTLPKGKREDKDATWLDTAQREVREEAHCETKVLCFAGAPHYTANNLPNVVLFWEMLRTDETDQIVWLPPCEAMEKLNHPAERQLVARVTGQTCCRPEGRLPDFLDQRRQRRRLTSALDALRAELDHPATELNHPDAARASKDDWWVFQAREFLALARCALQRKDFQSGWTYVHEIQILVIHGWDEGRLLAQALALRAEARNKLKGWRAEQVAALFGTWPLRELLDAGDCKPSPSTRAGKGANWLKWLWLGRDTGKAPSTEGGKGANWPNLDEPVRQKLRRAVIEAQRTTNGEHNNNYHRIALAKSQMSYLTCALGVVLLALYFFGNEVPLNKKIPTKAVLIGVMLFGALGGIMSAVFQISRAGQRKIPESVLTGVVTLARPLVGAASALFLYMVLISGTLKIFDESAMIASTAYVLAFAAGLSEQFVIQTASKVGGRSTKED